MGARTLMWLNAACILVRGRISCPRPYRKNCNVPFVAPVGHSAPCPCWLPAHPARKTRWRKRTITKAAQKSMRADNSRPPPSIWSRWNPLPGRPLHRQAQLELIYAKYRHSDLAGSSAAADRFIRAIRTAQVDYALYMKGLAAYEVTATSSRASCR